MHQQKEQTSYKKITTKFDELHKNRTIKNKLKKKKEKRKAQ